MKPPTSGPSIGATRLGMATKLIALTSSALGKVRTRVSRPTGTIMAPPSPCSRRLATRNEIWLVTPHNSEPSVKTAMAAAKTRRVPKRSAIQPDIGMKTARLSV